MPSVDPPSALSGTVSLCSLPCMSVWLAFKLPLFDFPVSTSHFLGALGLHTFMHLPFYVGSWAWTQVIRLAKQALYPQSYLFQPLSPFKKLYFETGFH